jgi:putative transposase
MVQQHTLADAVWATKRRTTNRAQFLREMDQVIPWMTLKGIVAPSVGSVGDAYDNALTESVIGLYKTEGIARQGPWRGLDPVEYQTLVWVAWFNQVRLLSTIGYLPPAFYEEQFAAAPACTALVPAHT